MNMNKMVLRFIVVTYTVLLCALPVSAQMTRGQMLKKFYQITTLHNSGRDADAVSICEEIIAAYPSYPDTYLRLAEIYDSEEESELALLMYRKYVSLEMDDDKVAECSHRLNELEKKFGLSHFEDMEVDFMKKNGAKVSSTSRESSVVQRNTVQPDDVSFESLFDISSIVSSASDESEFLSELQQDDDMPIPSDRLSSVSSELFSDSYQSEDPIPEETMKMIDFMFTSSASKVEKSADACSEPFRFISGNGTMSGIGVVPSNSGLKHISKFSSPESVCGRWSSSLYNDEDGLEFLLFDINLVGGELFLSFDGSCGLFREHRNNILKTSWNRIKSIWSTEGADYDARSIIDGMNKVDYSENHMSVVCQLKSHNRINVVNMGKNLLDNLSAFVPLGNIVNRLGGSLINSVNKDRSNATVQTEIELEIDCLTEDLYSCEFFVRENVKNSESSRSTLLENKSFYLYRMTEGYTSFSMPENNRNTPEIRALYRKLETESERQSSLLFPLAIMSYCKAGIGEFTGDVQALSRTVSQMQKLSDEGCLRASAWLVPVYYNLSMDENHYPLRLQRKKFREQEEKLLERMLTAGVPVAYGLKGDIIAGGYTDTEKSLSYYSDGMKYGDAHSFYRMGVIYREGQLVNQDYVKSLEYLRKAMEMEYADAFLLTAQAYRYGYGVEQDYSKYFSYLSMAVEAGSQDALKELSDALMIGIGVERNIGKAVKVRSLYLSSKNDIWRGVLDMYGLTLTD